MSDDTTNNSTPEARPEPSSSAKPKRSNYSIAGLAVLGTLILGVGAGAAAMKFMNQNEAQVLLEPVAVSAMTDGSTVAVKGTVAEIYGNSFIIQDASGRTLVEAGHKRGWSFTTAAPLVAKDEAVTVQGRFDNGSIHASMLVHADGKAVDLRPDGRGHDGGGQGGGKGGEEHGNRGGGHGKGGDRQGDRGGDQGDRSGLDKSGGQQGSLDAPQG
jgi:uncharacterized protein YdeI (BOF family)